MIDCGYVRRYAAGSFRRIYFRLVVEAAFRFMLIRHSAMNSTRISRAAGPIGRMSWLLGTIVSITAILTMGRVDAENLPNPSPLFESGDLLELRIEAPFATIRKSRGEQREYFPAMLTYRDEVGQEHRVDLRLRTRGKSRNDREVCRFPPLLLNFPRKSMGGTLMEGENRLKLVTHCGTSSASEQYVLLEYLSYRAMNIFSSASLRVRLAEITYFDNERNREVTKRKAFLIEDVDRMAGRVGMTRVTSAEVSWLGYDQRALNFFDLFQYFVGNTDWSVSRGPPGDSCCHNSIPMVREDGQMIPVAYDFDATGIVNAPYAVPSEKLPIRTVRQRLYRGFCQPEEIVQENLERFLGERDVILKLFRDQQGLRKDKSRSAGAYIDDFYEIISDPDSLRRDILDQCRSPEH
jgi:hypothetical protein